MLPSARIPNYKQVMYRGVAQLLLVTENGPFKEEGVEGKRAKETNETDT